MSYRVDRYGVHYNPELVYGIEWRKKGDKLWWRNYKRKYATMEAMVQGLRDLRAKRSKMTYGPYRTYDEQNNKWSDVYDCYVTEEYEYRPVTITYDEEGSFDSVEAWNLFKVQRHLNYLKNQKNNLEKGWLGRFFGFLSRIFAS